MFTMDLVIFLPHYYISSCWNPSSSQEAPSYLGVFCYELLILNSYLDEHA